MMKFVAIMLVMSFLPEGLLADGTGGTGGRAFEDPIPREVELLYRRGLNYLTTSQTVTGAWPAPDGEKAGVVGLAILAMLAHGDDVNVGEYSRSIQHAREFLLARINGESGYIGSSMYNHGFATLALAEAYGTVEDNRIGPALKRAVDLILLAQKKNTAGGWRYNPNRTDADITVSGAQMVALLAARNAGIEVPESAVQAGLELIKKCQSADGSFGYTPGSAGGNSPRAAIAVLAFALAQSKDSPTFAAGARFIQNRSVWDDRSYYFYFLYYLSQALFHSDMDVWQEWNARNIKNLTAEQNLDGSWSGRHGQTFATTTALLSLALNYRFLPIYER